MIDLRDATERAAADTTGDWTVAHHPLYDPHTGPPEAGDIAHEYRSLLDERGGALVEALRALACSPAPVLVHCTAGKDRTGLLVALALAPAPSPTSVPDMEP